MATTNTVARGTRKSLASTQPCSLAAAALREGRDQRVPAFPPIVGAYQHVAPRAIEMDVRLARGETTVGTLNRLAAERDRRLPPQLFGVQTMAHGRIEHAARPSDLRGLAQQLEFGPIRQLAWITQRRLLGLEGDAHARREIHGFASAGAAERIDDAAGTLDAPSRLVEEEPARRSESITSSSEWTRGLVTRERG